MHYEKTESLKQMLQIRYKENLALWISVPINLLHLYHCFVTFGNSFLKTTALLQCIPLLHSLFKVIIQGLYCVYHLRLTVFRIAQPPPPRSVLASFSSQQKTSPFLGDLLTIFPHHPSISLSN